MQALFRAVDRAGMDAVAEIIKAADACAAVGLVRRAMNV
jgi:hypothetical protein